MGDRGQRTPCWQSEGTGIADWCSIVPVAASSARRTVVEGKRDYRALVVCRCRLALRQTSRARRRRRVCSSRNPIWRCRTWFRLRCLAVYQNGAGHYGGQESRPTIAFAVAAYIEHLVLHSGLASFSQRSDVFLKPLPLLRFLVTCFVGLVVSIEETEIVLRLQKSQLE